MVTGEHLHADRQPVDGAGRDRDRGVAVDVRDDRERAHVHEVGEAGTGVDQQCRRQLREGGRRHPHAEHHAPEHPLGDRARLGPVDEARRARAHDRISRERRTRVGRRDDEVDLIERSSHHLVGLDPQLLGHGRGVEVVHRLGQAQTDRDLLGEIAGAPRPLRAEGGEERRKVPHHPRCRQVGRLDAEVDLDHPGRGDERLGLGPDLVLDARLEGDAAERRDDGHLPTLQVVRAQSGFPACRARERRRVEEVRPGARVEVPGRVTHRARHVADDDRVRARVRVRAARDPTERSLHPEQPGVAGRDADRSAAVPAGRKADEAAGDRG